MLKHKPRQKKTNPRKSSKSLIDKYKEENPKIARALEIFDLSYKQYLAATSHPVRIFQTGGTRFKSLKVS